MKKVIINDKGKVDQGVSKTDNKIHSKIKGKDPSIKYIKKKKGKQRKTTKNNQTQIQTQKQNNPYKKARHQPNKNHVRKINRKQNGGRLER